MTIMKHFRTYFLKVLLFHRDRGFGLFPLLFLSAITILLLMALLTAWFVMSLFFDEHSSFLVALIFSSPLFLTASIPLIFSGFLVVERMWIIFGIYKLFRIEGNPVEVSLKNWVKENS